MKRGMSPREALAGCLPDLPHVATWDPLPTVEQLAAIPNAPAVYVLIDGVDQPVQLATTQQLRRLLRSRLLEPPPPGVARTDLTAVVRGVRWRPVTCRLETDWWYWRLARRLHPLDYLERVAFGPTWFLQLGLEREPGAETPAPTGRAFMPPAATIAAARPSSSGRVPLITITTSPAPGSFASAHEQRGDSNLPAAPTVESNTQCLGPFPGRAAAQRALEGLWDLFDLCRHPEQVRRLPLGRRCAYADMGRCDAPCDGSAAPAAMAARTAAAWEFATRDTQPYIADATRRMADAAAAQEYERAGLLKQQLSFAADWSRPQRAQARLFEAWRYAVALRAAHRKAWKLFWFDRGALLDGPLLTSRTARRTYEQLCEGRAWLVEAAKRQDAVSMSAANAPLARAAWAWFETVGRSAPPALDDDVRREQTWLFAGLLQNPHRERAGVVLPFEVLSVDRLVEEINQADAAGDPTVDEGPPPTRDEHS